MKHDFHAFSNKILKVFENVVIVIFEIVFHLKIY